MIWLFIIALVLAFAVVVIEELLIVHRRYRNYDRIEREYELTKGRDYENLSE
jgi:purine-cytosine permease-like protein